MPRRPSQLQKSLKREEGVTPHYDTTVGLWAPSVLAKRYTHTQGMAWDKPNTDSATGKQDDRSEETQKKCPYSWFKRGHSSLSPCWSVLMYCTRFPLNKHATRFTNLCLSVTAHFYTADSPGLCHWPLSWGGLVAGIQSPHGHSLTSVSGQEPKPCFKLLQS